MGYRKGREVVRRRVLFVNRRPPHGTIYALEALEVVLVGAAFEQRVSLAFLDDGVYQLLKAQDPGAIDAKNFANGFRALEHYDLEGVYVGSASLCERGLSAEDLLMPVEVLDAGALAALMDAQDVILSF